jgi:hypothetical protein
VQKKAVSAVYLILFVSCGIVVYLLIRNLMLKKSLEGISTAAAAAKDKDSRQNIKVEQDIRRDMEEKYKADMISYQVVRKRLEQEKNRQREPEQKKEASDDPGK